jgi:hypothetical protein
VQNVPGGHTAVQVASVSDASAPYRPAGHGSGADTPASQYDPGGHCREHTSLTPTASLNVPAGQLLHTSTPPRLNRPAGHCATVGTVDPGGQA